MAGFSQSGLVINEDLPMDWIPERRIFSVPTTVSADVASPGSVAWSEGTYRCISGRISRLWGSGGNRFAGFVN
jgi:hypothetical protein